MASSRLEKIGTIYTRTMGLLKSGAMKVEDKPLWLEIYEAFPPKLEPKFDRPASNIPIRKIFYEEDVIRAKYHKQNKAQGTYNLSDTTNKTSTQIFIQTFNKLKTEGAISDEQIYQTAVEMTRDEIETQFSERQKKSKTNISDANEYVKKENVDIKGIFND